MRLQERRRTSNMTHGVLARHRISLHTQSSTSPKTSFAVHHPALAVHLGECLNEGEFLQVIHDDRHRVVGVRETRRRAAAIRIRSKFALHGHREVWYTAHLSLAHHLEVQPHVHDLARTVAGDVLGW